MGPEQRIQRIVSRTFAAVVAAAALASCGPAGDADGDPAEDAPALEEESPSPSPVDAPPDAPDDSGAEFPSMEVTGTATDTIDLRSEGPALQFLPARVSATAGERVVLRYRNGGELPHNFALFRRDDAIDPIVGEAYEASSSGYIPPSAAGELIAYSPLLSPGETAEMEFVVPPPGTYTFICLFPGHAQMMLGTFTAR